MVENGKGDVVVMARNEGFLKGRVKSFEWRSSPTCVGSAVKTSLLRIFTKTKTG